MSFARANGTRLVDQWKFVSSACANETWTAGVERLRHDAEGEMSEERQCHGWYLILSGYMGESSARPGGPAY